jgi:biopolymer transport protein ExbB/TolQ
MLNMFLNKTTGIVFLLILTVMGCFKVYTMGKEAGELKGKIYALQVDNKNLQQKIGEQETRIKTLNKISADCAKAAGKTALDLSDCAADLKKEKARNVRKEARAK